MAHSILLADDSSTIQRAVSKILTQAGYDVIQAKDGREAIHMAKVHKPDLAILDIVMPVLDGYCVCEQLKEMGEPWNSLPILFLTSVKSHALELLGREFGAYINKPVDPEHLLSIIDETLANTAETPNLR